jgi:hypothetical protein
MSTENVNYFMYHAKHYVVGLLTSAFDAGIASVKMLGGVAVASAAAPQLLSQLDLKHMCAVFAAASFWQVIDYFKTHKLEEFVAVVERDEAAEAAAKAKAEAGVSS